MLMISKWEGPKNKLSEKKTLTAHLLELRKRIIVAGLFFLAMCIAGVFLSGYAFDYLLDAAPGYNFIYETPSQLVIQYIKVGLIIGFVFAFPIIMYEVWKFLCPGLKKKEKKMILILLTFGIILFLVGIFFAYKIIIPFTLEYFLTTNVNDRISPVITISSYIEFISSLLLIFGIIFEVPIILAAFTQIGLLPVRLLLKGQKYVIILIFIIAAIITPPDVISQILVAIPMLLLFELSVGACYCIEYFKKRPKT